MKFEYERFTLKDIPSVGFVAYDNETKQCLIDIDMFEALLARIAELEAQLKSARKELHEAQIQRDTYKMDAEIAEDAIVELDKQVKALQAKQASDSCPVCFGTGQAGNQAEQLPFDGSPEKQASKFKVGDKVKFQQGGICHIGVIQSKGEGYRTKRTTYTVNALGIYYIMFDDELELDNSDEMA